MAELQRHVDRCARARGIRGRRLSPATIKKELVSLRTAWNWAATMRLVPARFPRDELRYPKADEKPPFMTRAEIERRMAAGGLSEAERADLWDCLYLTLDEVAELLDEVRGRAGHGWIHPMVCTAAHTGARRSELLRIRVQDVDLDGGAILIREKKRARGKRTTRRVPLSPALAVVLREWIDAHPGGPALFCHEAAVPRSKTKRSAPTPVTTDEAHDHLKRTLAGGRWSVLRGWHTLRHSFASNCAARGVDQRLIDERMGHTTEAMRRRYRHLTPDLQRQAIRSVFDGGPVPSRGRRS